MATKVVADPDTRIIEVVEVPVGGLQELDLVTDIYSPLKDDWQSTSTLQVVKFPFRTIGDPTRPGQQLGPYVFFDNANGWRFRPYNTEHNLTIVGGSMVGESVTLPLWVRPATAAVLVRDDLSAQALVNTVVTGSGVTAQDKLDIAQETWERVLEGPMSAEDMMRVMLSAMALLSTDDGTKFRDLANTKDRISGTMGGANGRDRIAVTVDGT